MALWPDIATWVGPTKNASGVIKDHMYVVVHISDGAFNGTVTWQKNPGAQVSSHFIVRKDGFTVQMVDTDQHSWAQIDGNPYSISIENEGSTGQTLTNAQVDANARILFKAHQVYGVPLVNTGRVGTRGLGHHSMGAESGVNWGHSMCPGNAIKAQKPAIVARALALSLATNGGKTMPKTIDDVYALLDRALNGFTDKGQPTENLVGAWVSGSQKEHAAQAADHATMKASDITLRTAVDTHSLSQADIAAIADLVVAKLRAVPSP